MRDTTPAFEGALVLTGGGTGGHFFPAVALAEGARSRWPDLPIAFVGARRGIEAQKLPEGPWPHLLLDVEGLVGRSPLLVARSTWKLGRAVTHLRGLWHRERPRAVIGTGGYGAAPALLAAWSMGIPYFLHESNAAPGALVRLVAPKARRVWCGMGAVLPLLPRADCRVVGTPVRGDFLRSFAPVQGLLPPFRLLVLGGSGGARAINEALLRIAPALLERQPDWELLHQTGTAEGERLLGHDLHPRHRLVTFIDRMGEAMEAASLVLGRSGASTCAELKAVGRMAILIPLPTSANDHQRMNALALVAEGRACLIEQSGDLAGQLEEAAGDLMGAATRAALVCAPEANRAVERCLDDLDSYLG